MVVDYVFGYGSLMNNENRLSTLPAVREVLPVRVQGLRREWNVQSILRTFTVLGVMPCQDAYCTGILFPVLEQELHELDGRERGYNRIEIASEKIKRFGAFERPTREGKIWTYTPQEPQSVNEEYPLVQSYLDIVLSGCLQFGEAFAKNFIRTTQGWSEYWVNDRLEPRARKIIRNIELEGKIDILLKEEIQQYFSQRI